MRLSLLFVGCLALGWGCPKSNSGIGDRLPDSGAGVAPSSADAVPTSDQRSLENALLAALQDNPSRANAYDDALSSYRKGLSGALQLSVDGRPYAASVLYPCERLDDRFNCRLLYADDTIHASEFPDDCPPVRVAPGSRLRLLISPPYTSALVVAYVLSSREGHNSGYATTRPIQLLPDGSFDTSFLQAKPTPDLFFAVLKGSEERLFKKYVWVLRP